MITKAKVIEVNNKYALVEAESILARVVVQPVGKPAGAEPELYLPARHVRVHVDVALGTAHGRRDAIDEHKS